EVDVDVVPAGEVVRDLRERLRVGGPEVAERLVGEHDPPAEGGVRSVALQDGDLMPRIRLLHQQGEIQPRRPAAEDRDLHGSLRALTGAMLARAGEGSRSASARAGRAGAPILLPAPPAPPALLGSGRFAGGRGSFGTGRLGPV